MKSYSNRLAVLSFFICFLTLLACSKGDGGAQGLFVFNTAKDVQVRVKIDFLAPGSSAVALDPGQRRFNLHAYVLTGNAKQGVDIVLSGQGASSNPIVTLNEASKDLDAVLRVPAGVEPGPTGYAFSFELQDVASSGLHLASAADSLRGLSPAVQPGTPPERNIVSLSLLSSLSMELMEASGLSLTSVSLYATYENLQISLQPLYIQASSDVISGTIHPLKTYAAAVQGKIKLALASSLDLQRTVADTLTPALSAEQTGSFAAVYTKTMRSYAEEAASLFKGESAAYREVFTTVSIETLKIPDVSTFTSIIFAPLRVRFSDDDGSAAIGGQVAITPSLTQAGLKEFVAYLGKEAFADRRLSELGRIAAGPSELNLVVPFGTAVPSGATHIWVYPIDAQGGLLDTPASVALVNRLSQSEDKVAPQLPATPTITFSAISTNSLTINWQAATDNVTPQAQLSYRALLVPGTVSIKSEADLVSLPSGSIDHGWKPATTTVSFTNLNPATTYTAAVAVRDEGGQAQFYPTQSVTTSAVTAPSLANLILTVSQIGGTAASVSWVAASDEATASSQLEYRLVYSTLQADIDTADEVAAITGSRLAMDWTAASTTGSLRGLQQGTSYYTAVAVRNRAGKMSVYTPAALQTLDVTAPTVGSGLTFSAVGQSTLTVAWGAASDNITSPSALVYKLVRAAATADIDSLSKIEAGAGVTTVRDWQAASLAANVTGLSSGTTYAFAVVVKDAAGLTSLYTPSTATTTTADNSAPTPGTAISFSSVTATTLTIAWGEASDNVTTAANLSYLVARAATRTAIDTVAEAEAATVVQTWTTKAGLGGGTTLDVTGLPTNTALYFAVVVKDEAGNKAIYSPQHPPAIWVYRTSASVASTFGGRSGADTQCQNNASSLPASITTAKAWISFTGDRVQDFTPTALPVRGSTGRLANNTWADFKDTNVNFVNAAGTLGFSNGAYFTAMDPSGAVQTTDTCSNFTSTTGSTWAGYLWSTCVTKNDFANDCGLYGERNTPNRPCSGGLYILCVGW